MLYQPASTSIITAYLSVDMYNDMSRLIPFSIDIATKSFIRNTFERIIYTCPGLIKDTDPVIDTAIIETEVMGFFRSMGICVCNTPHVVNSPYVKTEGKVVDDAMTYYFELSKKNLNPSPFTLFLGLNYNCRGNKIVPVV